MNTRVSPALLLSYVLFLSTCLLIGCDTNAGSGGGNGNGNGDGNGNGSDGPTGETFVVTVADKSSEHPNQGQGWPEGFVVDGEQGAELTLERGTTYTFQLQNVASIHSFYITTSEQGAGGGAYSQGVTGNFASGDATVTFTPGADTPDLLYYQCATSSHTYMGWIINVTGSSSSSSGNSGGDDGSGGDSGSGGDGGGGFPY